VKFKWRQYSLDERRFIFILYPERYKGQGFYLKQARDNEFMSQAFALAKLATGQVGHDPLVGAIFVLENQIIAKGYHQKLFGLHAEYDAFKDQDIDVKGATLYVTLEPCAHDDYFPSCAGLVIRKGIQRVVIASLDPNPIENGDGVRALKAAGILVEVGLMHETNLMINKAYFERFK
jgi:diaminohydroxyphosphoribosylaminopyrimidine deaminase / 5-amino-6-(5-phosphoribosylamino)uracil reductase